MRVNSWQGGQENNIFCKDMKTHSFHDQILAVSEITLKEKIKQVKNRNPMDVLRKRKRGNSTEDI